MSRLLAGLFLLVNCLIPPLAGAQQASVEQSGYFAPERSGCANDNGWHFYCDPKKQAKQSSQKKAPATPTTIPASPSAPEALPSLPTAREQLDSVGKQLEELKARAILEPTEANIHAYASYQEQQLSLAHSFADQWRRVLWRNPELDYNLVAPQGTQGKRAWVDQRRQAQRLTLARLQDRYGVFFFYTTSCVYCTVYSPALKRWAIQNNITVQGVSLDGYFLPEWPNSITDYGQFLSLGFDKGIVPATMLFDSETNSLIPIAYGIIGTDELSDRIYRYLELSVGETYATP